MKKLLGNIWAWVGAAIGLLLLLLGIETGRRKRAQLKLVKSELDGKDAVLEEKKSQVAADLKKEKQHQEELRLVTESKKEEELTPGQIEEFWSKKK